MRRSSEPRLPVTHPLQFSGTWTSVVSSRSETSAMVTEPFRCCSSHSMNSLARLLCGRSPAMNATCPTYCSTAPAAPSNFFRVAPSLPSA
eukprot:4411513-Pyramimonas_sp.AAC.1